MRRKIQMRRTKQQIKFEILSLCTNPQKITHIMSNTGTCHKLLRKYLDELIQKNLIEKLPRKGKGKHRYKITATGHIFIMRCRQLQELE